MNGITLTMAAGGAERHRRARRLMNDATRAMGSFGERRKVSSMRRKRGRYLTWRTWLSSSR